MNPNPMSFSNLGASRTPRAFMTQNYIRLSHMKSVLFYHADLQKWQFHTIQPKNPNSAKTHEPSSFPGSAKTKAKP